MWTYLKWQFSKWRFFVLQNSSQIDGFFIGIILAYSHQPCLECILEKWKYIWRMLMPSSDVCNVSSKKNKHFQTRSNTFTNFLVTSTNCLRKTLAQTFSLFYAFCAKPSHHGSILPVFMCKHFFNNIFNDIFGNGYQKYLASLHQNIPQFAKPNVLTKSCVPQ